MNADDKVEFELVFNLDYLRLLKSHVDYSLQNWPGVPARPAEEQEMLWDLRDSVNRMLLEHTFDAPASDK